MTEAAGQWGARRTALLAGVAAGTALGIMGLHRTGTLPGGSARWERTNHAGRPVTLAEGVALVGGTCLPLLVTDPPAALAVGGAGVAGAVDDLGGTTTTKGLRGHLRSASRGVVTTGAVKIVVLGASGLLACGWSDVRDGRGLGGRTLAGAALVAGSANLANLFDLRPGRALKVGLTGGALLAARGRPAAAAVTGAGLALLPADLRGESMLGDTGANPLGAAVGLAAAQVLGARGRVLALAVVTALTLASERVSFSRVIAGHPLLDAVDRWGTSR